MVTENSYRKGSLSDSRRTQGIGAPDGAGARVWTGALQKWSLPASTTKTQIEQALLAVDLFPRAAVLLSIFEGMSIADAATILDADVTLVRKAQAIGLRELTNNLARNEDQTGLSSPPRPARTRSAH